MVRLDSQSLTLLAARNFSGRTAGMRGLAGLGQNPERGVSQYVGPDVGNYISGLSAHVEGELRLHGADAEANGFFKSLCQLARLDRLSDRNPYSLSGGEQAVLTIATALARAPKRLLVDGTLEQLSPDARLALLDLISSAPGLEKLVLADNRLSEFQARLSVVPEQLGQTQATASRPQLSVGDYSPYEVSPVDISVNELAFAYRPAVPVLEGVCLRLEPGKIYSLVGPNGAGKTTLCRLLAGLYAPNAGTISLNGEPAALHKTPATTCAYHFQNPDLQLFETTTEYEIRSSMGAGATRNQGYVDALLRAFGLDGCAQTHPLDLPFTLRKRVAIAAAIGMQRPWILLDEPTLGQDDETSDAVLEMLRLQASMGCGVIIVTHSQRLMAALKGATIELGRLGP